MTQSQRSDDYTHERHAGNIGDVLKHHALGVVLEEILAPKLLAPKLLAPKLLATKLLATTPGPLTYIETHAGHGVYRLAPTGEWTAGVGRLVGLDSERGDVRESAPPLPDGPWLPFVRAFNPKSARPSRYPGSPRLAAALLRSGDHAVLFERDPTAYARLATTFREDPRFDCRNADGWAGALEALPAPDESPGGSADRSADGGGATLLVVDPPYSDRADWQRISDLLAAAVTRSPGLRAVVWYPVKSLARPNALAGRLQAAGLSGTLVELVTKPFDQKKKQLNGSGLLFIAPPAGALPRIAAALPALGEACSHEGAWWSSRMQRW